MSLEESVQQMLILAGTNPETYLELCNGLNGKGNGQLLWKDTME